jgi:2-C-methyl-D-erythritol 4-phosphate cytidylyltransferase
MVTAIIVAAGAGTRMPGGICKQYRALSGQPVLVHSLIAFCGCETVDRVLAVVPGDDLGFCRREILAPFGLDNRVQLVAGGVKRQESVRNGLEAAAARPKDIVVIHDGVRPLVQADQILACIDAARRWGAAVAAVAVVDTLKRAGDSGMVDQTIDRRDLWMAQTPQAFVYDLILRAHRQALAKNWAVTDDAALIEHLGLAVKIVPGRRDNLKITTAEDLAIAEALIRQHAGKLPSHAAL